MKFDLVIQGRSLADGQIAALAALCGSRKWRRLGPGAARLAGADCGAAVADICAQMRLDHAFVPATTKLSDFGLVAMDMDSTLIAIECIDELAAIGGIGSQVAEITAHAMRGEIEFAESLARRVALLAGLSTTALDRVYDDKLRLSEGAESMIEGIKARGIRTLLVSGGFAFFTERLCTRLGLDFACANQPEVAEGLLTGRLTGRVIDADGKAEKVREIRTALGLDKDRVIVIGDGANDIPMMAEAGVSIAYRAKPLVQRNATYRFNHVGLDGLLKLFG